MGCVVWRHDSLFGVTVVGEVFDTRNDGMEVCADAATLTAAWRYPTDTTRHIAVKSGTDAATYAAELNKVLKPLGVTAHAGGPDRSSATTPG